MEIKDLIRYNQQVRSLYLGSMEKLPWAQVVESRGLSFDSMRDVFLHLTLVEDRWISFIIPERFAEWVDPDFNSFKDIDSLRTYMQRVHENTDKYLTQLTTEALSREISVPWGKPGARLSVETCLTHMVLEDMIHYGELSAALWQLGLEAPYLGFWRFKYEKR